MHAHIRQKNFPAVLPVNIVSGLSVSIVLAAQNSNITVIMDIPYAYILSLLNTKNIKTSPLNKLLYIMLIWEIL